MALMSALLTGFVIPWIRSKTSEAQRKALFELAQIAVRAAEQIFNKPGFGEEKKKFVIEWLEKRGVSKDDINALIEAVVFDLKHGQAEAAAYELRRVR